MRIEPLSLLTRNAENTNAAPITKPTAPLRTRGQCRNCCKWVEWGRSVYGKPVPYDPGTDVVHLVRCPARQKRRPPVPDDVCQACGSLSVRREPGVGMHYAAIRCSDCGQYRWLRKPALS